MSMSRRKRKHENLEIFAILQTILERLDRIEKEIKGTYTNNGMLDVSVLSADERAKIKASIT